MLKLRPVGIGLLELMMSLLVIATIIFMANKYYMVTSENWRVAEAGHMIDATVNASYQWIEGTSDLSNLSIAKLVAAGLLPQSYGDGANINPWHGNMRVSAADNVVSILLYGIPKKSCANLRQKMQRAVFDDARCAEPQDNTQPCSGAICTYSARF